MTQQFLSSGVPLFKASGVPAMDPDCCCGTPDCTSYTCSSAVDPVYGHTIYTSNGTELDPCECRDFYTGLVRSKDYTYTVNIIGTAVGTGRHMTIGGTDYPISDVDVTGSYSFSLTHEILVYPNCESTRTPDFYLVSSEFLTTSAGQDVYAQVIVRGASVLSRLYTVSNPNQLPKESIEASQNFTTFCLQECLCKELVLGNGGTYTPNAGTEGHLLSGITFSGGED